MRKKDMDISGPEFFYFFLTLHFTSEPMNARSIKQSTKQAISNRCLCCVVTPRQEAGTNRSEEGKRVEFTIATFPWAQHALSFEQTSIIHCLEVGRNLLVFSHSPARYGYSTQGKHELCAIYQKRTSNTPSQVRDTPNQRAFDRLQLSSTGDGKPNLSHPIPIAKSQWGKKNKWKNEKWKCAPLPDPHKPVQPQTAAPE